MALKLTSSWDLQEVLRASSLAEDGRLACVGGYFLVAAESHLLEMLMCPPSTPLLLSGASQAHGAALWFGGGGIRPHEGS